MSCQTHGPSTKQIHPLYSSGTVRGTSDGRAQECKALGKDLEGLLCSVSISHSSGTNVGIKNEREDKNQMAKHMIKYLSVQRLVFN